MKKSLTIIALALVIASGAFAQTNPEKPVDVTETMYIMPKRGMEEKFEAAIKAHNTKYHGEGQYQAGLRKVEYGEKAGWYVWVFGPTTYSAIDSRPTIENGHAEDWSKTVDPTVETYGTVDLWEYNEDLSYGRDFMKTAKYYEVWSVKLKRGEYYRFKAISEKLKSAYTALGKGSFLIYNNAIHTANGYDVVMIWSFNSYAEWSKNPGIKAAYEKLYGTGSWQNMVDEWMAVSEKYDTEIRSFLK